MNTIKPYANKRLKTNETFEIPDEKKMFEAFVDVMCENVSKYDADDQKSFDHYRKNDNFDSSFTLIVPVSSLSSLIDREPVKLRILNKTNRKFQLVLPGESFSFSNDLCAVESRRVSISDFLLRTFRATLDSIHPMQSTIIPPEIDQFVLKRSNMNISEDDGKVTIDFTVKKGKRIDCVYFLEKTFVLFVNKWITDSQLNTAVAKDHWQCIEDQISLRQQISMDGTSFVANKSILPRAGKLS